jgi:hypothetical protein
MQDPSSRWWLSTSLLSVLFICTMVAAYAQAVKTLSSALGGDFPSYEAVFGKPHRTDGPTADFPSETRSYRASYAAWIDVTKAPGAKAPGAKVPGYVSIAFKKGSVKNWKEALVKVGLDGSKAKANNTEEYFTLTGVSGLKGGFKHVYWLPKNPDLDGLDNLQISQ